MSKTSGDDWKTANWDDAAQKTFWLKFRRNSSRRYNILSSKAELLFASGEREKQDAALSMLADCVNAYVNNEGGIRDKAKYPKCYKDDIISWCAPLLGQLHERDGNMEEAEHAYRQCWQIHFDDYAPKCSSTADESLLLLPQLFMKLGRYEEAHHSFAEFEDTVVAEESGVGNLRRLCYAWTHYGDLTGDYSRSIAAYTKLHGTSVKPYAEFEQQILVYPDNNGLSYEDPGACGLTIETYHHTAIPEVFERSRSSLVALDTILGPDAPTLEYRLSTYRIDWLMESMAPQLGAYFGEVLCRQLGGTWIIREPFMRSRVQLHGQEVNPFEIGYLVTFFGRKMTVEFDRLAKAASAG